VSPIRGTTIPRTLSTLLTVAALFALAPRSLAVEDYDHWYVVQIGGTRAGWSHMSQETKGDRIVTSNDTHIEIKRGRMPIEITIDMTFTETPEGDPIAIDFSQNLGTRGDTRFVWTWEGGEVTAERIVGGEPAPLPARVPEGDWMMPAEAARHFERQHEAGAETITQRLLQPAPPGQLALVEQTFRNFEESTVEVFGRTVPAIRVDSSMSMLPGVVTTSFLDENGIPLRTTTPMPGLGEMTMLLADKQLALAELAAPEIMVSTMIAPDRPIEGAREAKQAVYVLERSDGELESLPSTGAQRFERLSPSSGRVTIDVASPLPAKPEELAGAREGSSLIDIDDSAVITLAKNTSIDENAPPAEKAEALRRFVHDYIDEKNLGVGLATASEVCATKEGDCTEHAVLLAALLRRHGIPARVATGLLYVDSFIGENNVFGYHMWTQALIEGDDGVPRWVDLDAVLPPQWPTDATHITLAVSTMSDEDAFHALLDLVPLLGGLEVRVERVE